MAADLVETKALLDLDEVQDHIFTDAVSFVIRDPDTEEVTRQVVITERDYEDMGSPKQVTVTITPGDTLNGTS